MVRPLDEAVYKMALERIEELLPMVSDETPTYDPKAIELKSMSDLVIEYEEANFPIGNTSFL
jgi:HTH-type transcriptional regulator/antitoxin HigA